MIFANILLPKYNPSILPRASHPSLDEIAQFAHMQYIQQTSSELPPLITCIHLGGRILPSCRYSQLHLFYPRGYLIKRTGGRQVELFPVPNSCFLLLHYSFSYAFSGDARGKGIRVYICTKTIWWLVLSSCTCIYTA